MTWLGIEREVARSLERSHDRDAIQTMRSRGVALEFLPLMTARTDLLRVVRELGSNELGSNELVLTRRGWPVATLLSKRRWLALHRIVENQADALAAHRCSDAETSPIPARGSYRVRVSDEADRAMAAIEGWTREALHHLLRRLARSPELPHSERLDRRPHIRSYRMRGLRIVWRIDGALVTVVRIVTASGDEAT